MKAEVFTIAQGYANESLGICIDGDAPSIEEYRFKQLHEDRRLFLGKSEDWAYIFSYEGPSSGFGGVEFKITMEDGSEKVLIGPWSSRIGLFNAALLEEDHYVQVLTKENIYALMKVSKVNEMLKGTGYHLVPNFEYLKGEIYYFPEKI